MSVPTFEDWCDQTGSWQLNEAIAQGIVLNDMTETERWLEIAYANDISAYEDNAYEEYRDTTI